MRNLFSPIHAGGFRPGQAVTYRGMTARVVGWRSKRRGARGKSLVVEITAKVAERGVRFAVAADSVVPRKGNPGRGPLVRVA